MSKASNLRGSYYVVVVFLCYLAIFGGINYLESGVSLRVLVILWVCFAG